MFFELPCVRHGRYSWVKQGEVFLLHLLDDTIAFPIANYHLDKLSDHIDVENSVKEILMYASACSACRLRSVCKKDQVDASL